MARTSSSTLRFSKVLHGEVDSIALGTSIELLISPSAGRKLGATEQLYQRECECLYAVLALCGRIDGRASIVPVLLYPASVIHPESGGDYWPLRLTGDPPRINPALAPFIDEFAAFQQSFISENDTLPLGYAAIRSLA